MNRSCPLGIDRYGCQYWIFGAQASLPITSFLNTPRPKRRGKGKRTGNNGDTGGKDTQPEDEEEDDEGDAGHSPQFLVRSPEGVWKLNRVAVTYITSLFELELNDYNAFNRSILASI